MAARFAVIKDLDPTRFVNRLAIRKVDSSGTGRSEETDQMCTVEPPHQFLKGANGVGFAVPPGPVIKNRRGSEDGESAPRSKGPPYKPDMSN